MVRVAKLDLPATRPADEPLVNICINKAWLQIIESAVTRLEYGAMWKPGTDIDDAEQQVFELYLLLRNAIDGCGGDDVRVRQKPDEPCKLEVAYEDDEWEEFADLKLCPPDVEVTPAGEINIGGTIVTPSAPLGTGNSGFPVQPPPLIIQSPDRICTAAVNLAEILARTQKELCAKIGLSPLEQALAAVAVFSALVVFPPNILWALPLVTAIAGVNTFCTIFTTEDKEDLACILKQHAVEVDEKVLFDRGAIQNTLTISGRIPLQAIAFLLNYLDDSALSYAASVPAGLMPCPCPLPVMTVWVISRIAQFQDQNLIEPVSSRWWQVLTVNQITGYNRIVLRFDNVTAVSGQPSIGAWFAAWSSETVFDTTTRTEFYVHYMRLRRLNASGVLIQSPATLRVLPTVGGTVTSYTGTGQVTITNLSAVQINTNGGVNGFNNNGEYWEIEFSIRTGRAANSLRAINSLGQIVNWNRY